ncbi:MAG: hypothetical protein DWI00_03260 [Planctomycetota bacterium]|nr:MAG: hypothetical protein DWI00_03260 [Planctomycetota bacterium]
MAVFHINTNPSQRQLRQFGLLCVVLLPLITWVWGASGSIIQATAMIGAGLGLLGIFAPKLLKPVFIGLVLVSFPIGLIVGELVLLMIFVGVFLPMALLFRIMGRDALQRRMSVQSETFWVPRNAPANVRRYFQQY